VTRSRTILVTALLVISLGQVWSDWAYTSTRLSLSTTYAPQCIPSGIYSTCDYVIQSTLTPVTETSNSSSTGAESLSRFVVVGMIAVAWSSYRRRQRGEPGGLALRVSVVLGGLLAFFQTGFLVLFPGVISFAAALSIMWWSGTPVPWMKLLGFRRLAAVP
jgi:hypothetical protein